MKKIIYSAFIVIFLLGCGSSKSKDSEQVATVKTESLVTDFGDTIKEVKNTHDAPENLTNLETYIQKVIDGVKFEKIKE